VEEILNNINEDDLLLCLSPSLTGQVKKLAQSGLDYNAIGNSIANFPITGLITKGNSAWDKEIWKNVKIELVKIFCTEDTEYDKLRGELKEKSLGLKDGIIPLITLAINNVFGVTAGFIAPFVIIGILMFVKVGKEATCNYLKAEHGL